MKLTCFVNKKNRNSMGLLTLAFVAGVYYLTNHNQVFKLNALPMSSVDLLVPFKPWTIWVYISEYVYYVIAFLSFRNLMNVNKFLYSYLALSLLSCAIFFFWPTVFPRELYPLDASVPDGITKTVFSFLRTHMDTPANCLPSHHVSSCFLLAFAFYTESKAKFRIYLSWTFLISLSTLSTKQHYFYDVVTGFLLAVVFYKIFWNKIKYIEKV